MLTRVIRALAACAVGLVTLGAPPAPLSLTPVSSCEAAEPPAPSGKISFMIWGDPEERKAYEQLIAAFKAQQPGVQVELVYTPNAANYYLRMAIDFAGGTASDVYLVNYRRYAQFAVSGQFEPLDAYVAGSRKVRLNEFFPQTLGPYYWQGKLLGLPQNISSLVVYYNKDLFKAAGQPFPDPNWTWNDFVKTAKALTKDTNGDGMTDQFGLGSEAILFRIAPFIWMNGGELVDDPASPHRLALDAPASRAALQWFMDLQSKHKVVPDMLQERAEVSASRFLNGTMAMFFDSRRGVPTYRNISTFDWDVAPLPRGKQPAGILHSDGFFMASASKNKPAAWAFIEFASSVEGQTILATTGRTVPSLISVANSPAFLDPGKKPLNSRVFLDVIPAIRAVPVLPGWTDIESQVGQEIERAYHGNFPLDQSIKLAIRRTNEFFPK